MFRLFTLLMFLVGMSHVLAQGTTGNRYLISVRGSNTTVGPVPKQVFIDSLPHPPVPPGEWVISNDKLKTNVALMYLLPAEVQAYQTAHREYILEPDQQMIFNAGPASGPPAPAGWALNTLLTGRPTGLPRPECPPCQVTLYVVDTGVQKNLTGGNPHPQFGPGSSVIWGAGLLASGLIGSADPYVDFHNHGTGVASTAVGRNTGLFGQLPGGCVLLEPGQIYFPAFAPPWVSDALNVIFQASEQHLARRSDASFMNDGGVLLFANRTNLVYSELLERQMAEAAAVGLIVVTSAGNAASNSDPELPPASVPAPDACLPPNMISNVLPPPPVRSPSGLPLSVTLGNIFAPCLTYTTAPAEQLLLVGAVTSANTLWANTNYGLGTHLFAPGAAITRANSTSGAITADGNGTSYAAGYAAGLALYYLSFRPWASVDEVRNFVLSQVDVTIPTPGTAKPGMIIHNMNLTALSAPSCCLSYEEWASLKKLSSLSAPKLADPDADGLPNIVEWALNNDPKSYSTNRGLSIARHGGNHYLVLSVSRYDLCDATLTVEASKDLLDWNAPVPAFTVLSSTDPCANNRVSEALIPEASPKKFYRLRINAP